MTEKKREGLQQGQIAVTTQGNPIMLSLDPAVNPDKLGLSALMARSRDFQRRGLPRSEAAIRGILKKGTVEFNKARVIAEKTGVTRTGSLNASAKRRLTIIAKREILEVTRRTTNAMKHEFSSAAKRELRAQMRRLALQGVPPIDVGKLKSLANQAADNSLNTNYPGTQENTLKRINRLSQVTLGRYKNYINAPNPEARIKAMDDLRRGLHDTTRSARGIPGGSVSKSLQRVSRTEQSRAMREVNLGLGSMLALSFAYWRLSSSHPNYGGNEVCDLLAGNTGPGVENELERIGADMGIIDTAGLYLINDFPEIPHPNCLCGQELWFPPLDPNRPSLSETICQ